MIGLIVAILITIALGYWLFWGGDEL